MSKEQPNYLVDISFTRPKHNRGTLHIRYGKKILAAVNTTVLQEYLASLFDEKSLSAFLKIVNKSTRIYDHDPRVKEFFAKFYEFKKKVVPIYQPPKELIPDKISSEYRNALKAISIMEDLRITPMELFKAYFYWSKNVPRSRRIPYISSFANETFVRDFVSLYKSEKELPIEERFSHVIVFDSDIHKPMKQNPRFLAAYKAYTSPNKKASIEQLVYLYKLLKAKDKPVPPDIMVQIKSHLKYVEGEAFGAN